ncbi:MAG: hypothetical protein GXP63_03095 [DPANN group archaeon]|nr:hypothetical protein [DPANN group archaeon]
MSLTYLSPSWFFGYDVVLELLFAAIALMVSIFAFRIYKATGQKQIRLFGASFACISLAYLIQSLFNYLIISKANEHICRALKIRSIAWFDAVGLYAHILFMTLGLVTLVYMTFKTEKSRILWLLIATSLLGIFLSMNTLYMFFLFSTIYLMFISWHFITNYLQNRQKKTLLIAVAFLFMLFGSVHFLMAVDHRAFYAIGHVLELVAYSLILLNLYLVRKR